jgi:LmbE family N-acetylglucosaminyl deacetylase
VKRRDIIKGGLVLPIIDQKSNKESPKLKILVAGAHPDDPETGCGGSIAKWTAEGHTVTIVYLTRGEGGIEKVSHEKAAEIRTKEALEACKFLKARPVFLGQIDGETTITNQWYEKVKSLLLEEKPDVIFTHWPVDSHRDHRACSLLFYDAWLYGGFKEAFYYYEVLSGVQTQNFTPSHYSDISKYRALKVKSVVVHQSQFFGKYDEIHEKMEIFRGLESNCDFAEAFVKHTKSKDCTLF